jgi:5-methylcytosine-specific restriction protein A
MTDTHAFRHEPRDVTDQQRAKIFLERGGCCEGACGGRKIRGEVWHLDHIIALECGGTNDPSNLQVLCAWCHKAKTKGDHATAAKIRAVATAHVVPVSQRQKRGKPLPGTKRSGWKRKMDGTWERRS